jgi:hypothetical protein
MIEVEDHVGFLTAARLILRSVKGDVTRGRPERFLGLSDFFSAMRFKLYPAVLFDMFITSEIRLIEYFCSLSIFICARCARDSSRVFGILTSRNSKRQILRVVIPKVYPTLSKTPINDLI